MDRHRSRSRSAARRAGIPFLGVSDRIAPLRQIGKAVRSRALAEALTVEQQVEPRQAEEGAADDETARLRAAIDGLPADQKSAVALFYLEELSVAEVAVALNAPAGTIKTRLMHARRKLRAALEGEK